MLRMILIQLWNERKANVMLFLELMVVSVFLWYAADALYVSYKEYARPMGFDISHVYHVQLGTVPQSSADYDTTALHSRYGGGDFLSIYDRLSRHPMVESVCYTSQHFHYRWTNMYATFQRDSLVRNGYVRFVSTSYFEVFRVGTADGSPAERLAQALNENRIVVTGTLATDLFGNASEAVSKEIQVTDQGAQDSVFYNIGAVCEPQRYTDFSGYDCAYYRPVGSDEEFRNSPDQVAAYLPLFIRVKPGADGRDFAETFQREMEQQLRLGNIYLKEVVPMSHYRIQILQSRMDEIRMYASCILFFLLNVFLGIIGTFWFRTQQRRAEIGLRMAMGASRLAILRQFFGEGLLLAGVAFVPALLVFVNLMRLDVTQQTAVELSGAVRFFAGMGMTLGLVAVMVAVGVAVPAYRAMRLQPVETLHDE